MKTRKAFLYGFLMLAFVTLLSGVARSNTVSSNIDYTVTTVEPPGMFMPTLVLNVFEASPESTYYCTLNPGYAVNASVTVSDGIVYADMPSMQCNIYYTINKPVFELPTLTGYAKDIDKYPFQIDRDINKKSFASSNLNTDPSRPNAYRVPRDGLWQSWRA